MKKMFLMTLSLMLFAFSGWSQKTVTGVVYDTSGLPLPGAAVIIDGTGDGVATDFDGYYSIEVSREIFLYLALLALSLRRLLLVLPMSSTLVLRMMPLNCKKLSSLHTERKKENLLQELSVSLMLIR